jgi:hypothetical protein
MFFTNNLGMHDGSAFWSKRVDEIHVMRFGAEIRYTNRQWMCWVLQFSNFYLVTNRTTLVFPLQFAF